ncbi:MAG: phosphate transporter [Firmicutes bacterium]|nr:phosphate transporter [Bacillota bacterium]
MLSWEVVAIVVVIVALFFLLTNGLHDASSVVATMIACGATTPAQAILVAAGLELVGAMFGGNAVALTIIQLIDVPVKHQLLIVLLVAFMGAMSWNVITWRIGLPSSSTHALVGGLMGATLVAVGCSHIQWGVQEFLGPFHRLNGIVKIVVSLLISPLLGFTAAFLLQKAMKFLLRRASFTVNTWLKRSQIVIAGLLAFSHGSNDSQKVIGLAALALAAGEWTSGIYSSRWLLLFGGLVMCTGILLGGWTIIKTLGRKVFPLRPLHSFDSLFASCGTLFLANWLGMPISTTHLVAGTVIGVGAADDYRMVNWEIGREMLLAWLVTIPASGVVAGLLYFVIAGFVNL